ncbi:hypothetical protein KAH94_02700 [bacterium]|nr:hypothetical protein [bacterium]
MFSRNCLCLVALFFIGASHQIYSASAKKNIQNQKKVSAVNHVAQIAGGCCAVGVNCFLIVCLSRYCDETAKNQAVTWLSKLVCNSSSLAVDACFGCVKSVMRNCFAKKTVALFYVS